MALKGEDLLPTEIKNEYFVLTLFALITQPDRRPPDQKGKHAHI